METAEFVQLLRTLRNDAAAVGDWETAYRHERRLQILLGVPESFTSIFSRLGVNRG